MKDWQRSTTNCADWFSTNLTCELSPHRFILQCKGVGKCADLWGEILRRGKYSNYGVYRLRTCCELPQWAKQSILMQSKSMHGVVFPGWRDGFSYIIVLAYFMLMLKTSVPSQNLLGEEACFCPQSKTVREEGRMCWKFWTRKTRLSVLLPAPVLVSDRLTSMW